MAIEHCAPHTDPDAIQDPATFDQVAALLGETGWPVSKSTLRRLIREAGRPVERHGRTDYVSYSDALELHRDYVRERRMRER